MQDIPDALPGADLIREGLRDLARGVESVPALVVLIGAPRLRRIGFIRTLVSFERAAERANLECGSASYRS